MACNILIPDLSPLPLVTITTNATITDVSGNSQRVFLEFTPNGSQTAANLTVASNLTVSGTGLNVISLGNNITDTIGFYGATPVVRGAAIVQTYATATSTLNARTATAITDSTAGTADGTLADVTASFSQSVLNNNFADLAAKYNALVIDDTNTAQVLNGLIDRLQTLGLIT